MTRRRQALIAFTGRRSIGSGGSDRRASPAVACGSAAIEELTTFASIRNVFEPRITRKGTDQRGDDFQGFRGALHFIRLIRFIRAIRAIRGSFLHPQKNRIGARHFFALPATSSSSPRRRVSVSFRGIGLVRFASPHSVWSSPLQLRASWTGVAGGGTRHKPGLLYR